MGVVTSSQIERKLPTTANTEARNSNDLAYRSVAQIWLISLNVTTPSGETWPAPGFADTKLRCLAAVCDEERPNEHIARIGEIPDNMHYRRLSEMRGTEIEV